jgi:carboxyl-terminal processing protease
VRAEIPQTTVRYAYMLQPGTGYISITDFSRSTGEEVARAIDELRGEGMQRLLLDLRNNGGGLLDQAIEVSEQFLEPASGDRRDPRPRARREPGLRRRGPRPPLGLPLVVLVNAGTASAAEIVSGAIQDHDVGLVVGTPTWGKGLVQTVFNLSYGAGLALTTAKYYTPSGRLIQRDYHSFYDYYARTDVEGEDAARRNGEREPYATDLGRKVFGGGGITPDVVVEAGKSRRRSSTCWHAPPSSASRSTTATGTARSDATGARTRRSSRISVAGSWPRSCRPRPRQRRRSRNRRAGRSSSASCAPRC